MNTYKHVARLLGIRISHTTQSSQGEYWQLEAPASPKPAPFSKDGPAIYQFATEDEVEAFITGYSLVVRAFLDGLHTPTKP
jgi:hypothetical protein